MVSCGMILPVILRETRKSFCRSASERSPPSASMSLQESQAERAELTGFVRKASGRAGPVSFSKYCSRNLRGFSGFAISTCLSISSRTSALILRSITQRNAVLDHLVHIVFANEEVQGLPQTVA